MYILTNLFLVKIQFFYRYILSKNVLINYFYQLNKYENSNNVVKLVLIDIGVWKPLNIYHSFKYSNIHKKLQILVSYMLLVILFPLLHYFIFSTFLIFLISFFLSLLFQTFHSSSLLLFCCSIFCETYYGDSYLLEILETESL